VPARPSASTIADRSTGYSPLDFSVLDPHWGNIDDWRHLIDAIHARGMYFMADFTVGTMSDLIGFEGYVAWLHRSRNPN
jgi:alpha-1,3-glucan synthase